MIWPHLVLLYPSVETTDERGNTIRRPVGHGQTSRAYVQPRGSTEAGTVVAEQAVVYLPAGAPRLDAFSRVEWGRTVYETVGAAVPVSAPAGPHHWRITLRNVGT